MLATDSQIELPWNYLLFQGKIFIICESVASKT